MTPTRTALYYPEILIPSKQFIRKAILYWDEIGSIVPKAIWKEHPMFELENEETNQLKDAGIYRPFFPDTLRNYGRGELEKKFSEEFFNRLDFFNKRDVLTKNKQYTEIYNEKELIPGLFSELERRGLAERLLHGFIRVKKANFPVYHIETTTSNIYMSLLAEFLAENDENITVPIEAVAQI